MARKPRHVLLSEALGGTWVWDARIHCWVDSDDESSDPRYIKRTCSIHDDEYGRGPAEYWLYDDRAPRRVSFYANSVEVHP